jgi:hypothetical protein
MAVAGGGRRGSVTAVAGAAVFVAALGGGAAGFGGGARWRRGGVRWWRGGGRPEFLAGRNDRPRQLLARVANG